MLPLQLKVKERANLEKWTESAPSAVTCAAAAEIDVELSDSDTEQKQQETLMSHITEDHMTTDWESTNGQCRLKHHICEGNVLHIIGLGLELKISLF